MKIPTANDIVYIADLLEEAESYVRDNTWGYSEYDMRSILEDKLEDIKNEAAEKGVPFIANVNDIMYKNYDEDTYYEESSYYEEEYEEYEDDRDCD